MKLLRLKVKSTLSAVSSLRLLLALCLITAFLLPLLSQASPPAWWTDRGVTDPSKAANDYAAVNQGQAKFIAKQAMMEMDAHLPGGAGSAVHNTVASWAPPTASANDYAAINLGQLKRLAQPFYDRLIIVGYANAYPWAGGANPASDYAAANIGQVKNLFSFDFTHLNSANPTALPTWWTHYYFPGQSVDPSADPDVMV